MKMWAILLGLAIVVWINSVSAFVFLNTSTPIADTKKSDSAATSKTDTSTFTKVDSAISEKKPQSRSVPHFGNVLFLSADGPLIFSYLGVLRALEKYNLHIDLIVAESKATLVAATWALNYPLDEIESLFLRDSINQLWQGVKPDSNLNEQNWSLNEQDPLQWKINLNLKNLMETHIQGNGAGTKLENEYLHLAWMISKLTHDAPQGPVEELAATPKPLMVQVLDLTTGEIKIVAEGSLQTILKGSLLPLSKIQKSPPYRHFASGSSVSANQFNLQKLPFTFNRLLLVDANRIIEPKIFNQNTDATSEYLQKNQIRSLINTSQMNLNKEKIFKIEIVPSDDFDPQASDPQNWITLGYLSTLRSIDYLRTILPGAVDTTPALGAISAPVTHVNLGLNRVSVNPLASGGRQHILDLVRSSERGTPNRIGVASLNAILNSGFYSDLDLEWTRAIGEENASLTFDAKEKSRIQFKSGWNAALTQADVAHRPPKIFASLEWDEPFYIPFHTDVGVLLGGPTPGYQARAMIAPLYPVKLDIGVSTVHYEIDYPYVVDISRFYHSSSFTLKRTLSELFLKVYPLADTYLKTSIQKHVMKDPFANDPSDAEFISTDFKALAFLNFGKWLSFKKSNNFIRIGYQNLNRDNLFGSPKYSHTNFESTINFAWNALEVSDQYYWSNQDLRGATDFDIMESGEAKIFSFQNEYFLGAFRSAKFRNVNLKYVPTLGNASILASLGALRHYGEKNYYQDQSQAPTHSYWELGAGYKTKLGVWRIGAGALQNKPLLYYLSFGAHVKLGYNP